MSVAFLPPRSRLRDRDVILLVLFVHGLLLFVGSVFLAEHLSEGRARRALLAAVAKPSSVVLDGRAIANPAVLLGALRTIKHVPAHHSAPTVPIHLVVQSAHETTAVILARDSDRRDEFWVYRPGSNWHNDPLGQEAGRIISPALDSFLRDRGF